ncbi:hypothetical protein DKP78_23860 [Enterococcus faecium]|nr:hypothetical protein DKP78_23860 [Enterococcus faecium]
MTTCQRRWVREEEDDAAMACWLGLRAYRRVVGSIPDQCTMAEVPLSKASKPSLLPGHRYSGQPTAQG